MDKEKFKQVSKDDFYAFVKAWPNKLEWDVTGICEPPLGSYNDFSNGKVWPESIVARISMDWMGPNGEIDREGNNRFWEYFILDVCKDTTEF